MKSLGTLICELSQFQSFINALGIISSTKIHFTEDGIIIHSTDTANVAFIVLNYKTTIATPLSIAIDLVNIKGIKSDVVQIYHNNNSLVFHDDGLVYNCASLSDPNVDRRDREGPEVKWEHVIIPLTSEHIKKILTMVNSKNKYDITLQDHTLTINDATDNNRAYHVEVEVDGSYSTRIHGDYITDIFTAPKHFSGCNIILGNDTPFKVEYECTWLNLAYLVAPMIDKET